MIFLAFLIPLAVYFLILAVLNRSQQPILVSGTWDFVGVLFAASGFLIFGGPAILTGLYEQWRVSWVLGQTTLLQELTVGWSFWIAIWSCYFLVIVAGSALRIRRLRSKTSIYNVDPAQFERILHAVLVALPVGVVRAGPQRLRIQQLAEVPEPTRRVEVAAWPAQAVGMRATHVPLEAGPGSDKSIGLSWEPFALMRHVSLSWDPPGGDLRHEVESALAESLRDARPSANPAGGWFMSISTGLFFLSFVLLLSIVASRVFRLFR